jgi:dTDP-4-dehydrorhamnose 3,5-epimerase
MNTQLKLQVTSTPIHDMLIIESRIFSDERGWFTESFNAQDFSVSTGLNVEFVQDNHSFSHQWTLRGLHYQTECPQGKLVRVVTGRIFDVVVDLRKASPSYGKWLGIEVDSQNHRQLWIPEGLAHGFLALTETVEVLYKTTDYYHPQSEICLAWNDPQVNIKYPLPKGITPNLNAKDAVGLLWDVAPKF